MRGSPDLCVWIVEALGGNVYTDSSGVPAVEAAPTRGTTTDGETLRPSAVTALLAGALELALQQAAPPGIRAKIVDLNCGWIAEPRGQVSAIVERQLLARMSWQPGRDSTLRAYLVDVRTRAVIADAEAVVAIDARRK